MRELAEALRERLAVIADRALYARDPAAHLQRLQSASTRIVEIQGQLPRRSIPSSPTTCNGAATTRRLRGWRKTRRSPVSPRIPRDPNRL